MRILVRPSTICATLRSVGSKTLVVEDDDVQRMSVVELVETVMSKPRP